VRLAGVAPQPRDGAGRDDADLKTCRIGEARKDIPIAPIVATATDDDDAVRQGPAGAQVTQRSLPRALHQGVAGNLQGLDGAPVQRAHLFCGINANG
jgi:hypothetical protein